MDLVRALIDCTIDMTRGEAIVVGDANANDAVCSISTEMVNLLTIPRRK